MTRCRQKRKCQADSKILLQPYLTKTVLPYNRATSISSSSFNRKKNCARRLGRKENCRGVGVNGHTTFPSWWQEMKKRPSHELAQSSDATSKPNAHTHIHTHAHKRSVPRVVSKNISSRWANIYRNCRHNSIQSHYTKFPKISLRRWR